MPQWARVGHVRQLHGWHVVFLAEVNEGAQLSCHLDVAPKSRTSTISAFAGPPDARARSTSANFDFGQFFFRLRPISTSANSTSANFWMLNFGTTKSGALKGGGPEGWSPEGWGPEGWGPRRVVGPKFRAFFFPLLPQLSFFSPSLWWCLKRRGPEMCTFGVLRLSCEARGPAEGCPAEGCPAEGCPAEGVEHPFNMWSRKSSKDEQIRGGRHNLSPETKHLGVQNERSDKSSQESFFRLCTDAFGEEVNTLRAWCTVHAFLCHTCTFLLH